MAIRHFGVFCAGIVLGGSFVPAAASFSAAGNVDDVDDVDDVYIFKFEGSFGSV